MNLPTPYFDIEILRASEDFQAGIPALSPLARQIRDHSSYISKKRADYVRRYDRSLIDAMETAKAYHQKVLIYLNATKHLMTDYDIQHILTSTCALGMWKSASTDLENLGVLGAESNVRYPKEVTDEVVKWYKKYLPKDDTPLNLSLPRGTLIGYPFMVGGMNRSLNDVCMALSACLVIGNDTHYHGDDKLANLYRNLFPYHGEPFDIEGTRNQTTAKTRIMRLKEGIFYSKNFQARDRVIIVAGKMTVMIIRVPVKRMLGAILNSPNHTQDRSVIDKTITSRIAQGWFAASTDFSKFDFHHGGARGKQQLEIHRDVLNDRRYYEDSLLSFETRMFIAGYDKYWEFPGDLMLKSGMGNTTLVGCTGNFTATLAALSRGLNRSPASLVADYQKTWEVMEWGDDGVVLFKDPSWWDALIAGYKFYKLKVEEEPTIKFLGSNYANGRFPGTMDKGYAMGRAFQQQFFPERQKVYPFTTIGYIARLDLMGPKGKDWHHAVKPFFEELELGVYFSYEERHDVLAKLVPEMQKYSAKIGMLDSVLQIFTHGLQGADAAEIGGIPSIYFELLGQSSTADLNDPIKFISDLVQDHPDVYKSVTPDLLSGMSSVLSGKLDTYGRTLSQLSTAFNLNYQTGSVIY